MVLFKGVIERLGIVRLKLHTRRSGRKGGMAGAHISGKGTYEVDGVFVGMAGVGERSTSLGKVGVIKICIVVGRRALRLTMKIIHS